MSHFNKIRNLLKHYLSKKRKSYTSFDKQTFVRPTDEAVPVCHPKEKAVS